MSTSYLPSMTALRCFDASARSKSFTRAAQRVHLTQGAVSHQVIALEASLGVRLFVRRRSGLELTEAGRSYWNEVASALRQIERATQDIVAHQGRGGRLNLSVASSFANYWLVPRLSSFVQDHPDITLNLSTRIGPIDFAGSQEDAAIEYCQGEESGLCAVRVHALELRPYAAVALLSGDRSAPGRTRRPSDLADLLRRHVLIRHTTVAEAWPGWVEVAGLSAQVGHDHLIQGPQYDLMSMAMNAVIGGLGIGLLPRFMTENAVQSGRLACLSELGWQSSHAYHLRYPPWKGDLAPLQRFQTWLLTQVAGDPSATPTPQPGRHETRRPGKARRDAPTP